MPGKADKGTGTGRGRPRGPRAPSARDLAHTPEITQYYGPEQPPLAPILQQDTGEVQLMSGASSRRLTLCMTDTDASVNDLAEDAASSSNVVTSLSTHTNAASSEQTCSALDVIAQQRMTTVMRTRELLPRLRGLCLVLSRQRLALSRTVCKSFEMSGPSRYDRGSLAQGPLHPRATRR